MKYIPYATQWIDKEDMQAVRNALKSSNLTQGPLVEEFEKAVATYCGARYAVAVNSGTSALHIACLAAGLKKGDEAITSPITFAASANCVLYCGAKPIFADIDDNTISVDPKEIEKKISSRTKIIIPVDFAGYPVHLKEIKKIAMKYNLVVIEDATHALGAEYDGVKIGSCKYADMVVFSFHAVKNITCGEGGMVLTNNKKYYQKMQMLRSHGITKDARLLLRKGLPCYYEMQLLGFNYRITDIQSALGKSQLNKIDFFIKERSHTTDIYNKAFCQYEELKLMKKNNNSTSARHLYIVRFDPNCMSVSRDRIIEEYSRKKIGVNVHYIPVYYQPFYRALGYKEGICPKAEKYYKETVSLPLFPKMKKSEIKKVIRTTLEIIEKFKK